MKHLSSFLLVVVFLSLLHPHLLNKAYTGDLGAMVRLSRLTPNTSTGGTICATPETAATESSLQVIFPTGMGVNQTASNWTVTTTNLPDGTTAMPGIATATGVSGHTVTFPVSDLNVGTQYCFNFSSANTLTNPSSTGNYRGTLRTRDNSNNTIDTRNFELAIVANDRIAVTATVPASPTDFSAQLELTDHPSNTLVRENTTLTYKITYGSLLPYNTSITVQAQWEQGTITGNSTQTEDVVSYVVGSASDAYNGAEPVIDTLNRTISWEIPSFPADTAGQTVTFKLKVYDDYTGPQPVNFNVHGRVLGPGTQTADSTVASNYKFSSFITPTPTPTCVPSQCPTPIPTSTPTPTPVPDATIIENIEVRTISQSDATVSITSNNRTTARIRYGTSKNNLTESLSYLNLSRFHLLTFEGLTPQTRYYFRVTLTDEYSRVVVSDLYVFDTATESTPPQALSQSLIITSNDVVLTDPLREESAIPRIVLPRNTTYAFKFAVSNYQSVDSIRALLRNDNVLGLSSSQSFASNRSLTITEISPGQYIGRLNTNPVVGTYNLVLQISDFSGNLTEQRVSTIKVVDPVRIVTPDNKGIENAKVTLYYYNERLKTYELLSSDVTPIKNPSYSEPDGSVAIVLPEGKYRAEIEAIGYDPATVDFAINPNSDDNYPAITLSPLPFSILTYLKYSASTASDVVALLQQYLHTLRTSIRFFDLMAFGGFLIMTGLLVLSASRRMSVPVQHLPYFLIFHLLSFVKKPDHEFILRGKAIVEGVEDVIADAIVYVTQQNGKVIAKAKTNNDGEFFAKITTDTNVYVVVSKKGFTPKRVFVKKADLNDNVTISLSPRKRPQGFTLASVRWYINFFTGSLFETILILTLLVEVLFILEFGFLKVAPFLLVSFFNLLLWAFHVRHTRSA